MSLLNDARRVADGGYISCWCDQGDHDDGCPVPSMPRIVAALEAVMRVVPTLPETSVFLGSWKNRHCRFCGATTYQGDDWVGTRHKNACLWPALMDVLKEGS